MCDGLIWPRQETGSWPPWGESHIQCIDSTKMIFGDFIAFDNEAVEKQRGK